MACEDSAFSQASSACDSVSSSFALSCRGRSHHAAWTRQAAGLWNQLRCQQPHVCESWALLGLGCLTPTPLFQFMWFICPALLPDALTGLIRVSLPFCLSLPRGWADLRARKQWTGVLFRTQPSPKTPVLESVCFEHQTGLKISALGWILPWCSSASLLRSWLPVLSLKPAPTAESQQA